MTKQLTPLLVVVLLASCGGSGTNAYIEAVDLANKKEAEARAAGVASPCSDVSQCAVLTFQSPLPICEIWTYKSYSLVSPTAAAASAAAVQQNVLARQALALAPPSNVSCSAVVPSAPVLTCSASTCGP